MRTRLRPSEEAVLVVRRHVIALVGPALVVLFLAGGLAAASLAPNPAFLAVAGAGFVAGAVWALWRWLAWSRDLWVVTTSRVIDESGVLTVRMVDSPLETIHNVTCEQSIFGRLLGFGKVMIQTAAAQGAVTLEGIGRPEAVRDAIIDMKERRRMAGAGGAGSGGTAH